MVVITKIFPNFYVYFDIADKNYLFIASKNPIYSHKIYLKNIAVLPSITFIEYVNMKILT